MKNNTYFGVLDINGAKVSYISNKPIKKNIKNVVFLFSPGASNAKYYSYFFSRCSTKYTLVSINYPGRGDSSVVFDNSVKNISAICAGFINKLCSIYNVSRFSLFGLSFGGTILIETIKNLNIKNTKRVVIVNGVEFFNSPSKIFFKLILLPCFYSKNTRIIYKYVFTKIFIVFEDFGKGDLLSIAKQIYSIVDYKFKPHIFYSKIIAVFINSKKDEIILKKHIKLLKQVFKKGKFIKLNVKTHRVSKASLLKIFTSNIFLD